jgi:hypothetical protein
MTSSPTKTIPIPETDPHTTTVSATVTSAPDVCSLGKDQGTCSLALRRYYFDASRGECKPFAYGGCGGNANNFNTFADCLKMCTSTVPTKITPVTETDTVPPTAPTITEDTACEIGGQVFTECGTACPSVCGEEAAVFCTLQCVRGCQCPGGTMLDTLSKQCVTPDQCSPGWHCLSLCVWRGGSSILYPAVCERVPVPWGNHA